MGVRFGSETDCDSKKIQCSKNLLIYSQLVTELEDNYIRSESSGNLFLNVAYNLGMKMY